MTLAQLHDSVRAHLSYDLDGYTPDLADATLLPVANWAIRDVAGRCRLVDPSIPFDLVAGQGVYDLRSLPNDGRLAMVATKVILGGRPLRAASGDYGLWAIAELERSCPSWRTSEAGVPTKAALVGTSIVLHPAPSAAVVAQGGCYLDSTYLPAPLTIEDLGAELPLPTEVHEAVVYCMALRLATPTSTEDSQYARLKALATYWETVADELGRHNESTQMAWGTTFGNEGDDWMCI